MSKSLMVTLCVGCVILATLSLGAAERPKPAEKLAVEGPANSQVEHSGPAVVRLDTPVQTKAPKNRVVGVIQYDDGVMTGLAGAPTSSCWGNQFNSALGGSVNANGSVTQLQFYMASVAGSAAFVSVFGPVAGTVAPVLNSVNVPAAAGTWNTHVYGTPISYTGSSFLAGVWLNAAPPGADAVALGTGTTAGQGMHGMHINDVVGTGFTAPGTFNALVRAGGDILVPVELMSFSVE